MDSAEERPSSAPGWREPDSKAGGRRLSPDGVPLEALEPEENP